MKAIAPSTRPWRRIGLVIGLLLLLPVGGAIYYFATSPWLNTPYDDPRLQHAYLIMKAIHDEDGDLYEETLIGRSGSPLSVDYWRARRSFKKSLEAVQLELEDIGAGSVGWSRYAQLTKESLPAFDMDYLEFRLADGGRTVEVWLPDDRMLGYFEVMLEEVMPELKFPDVHYIERAKVEAPGNRRLFIGLTGIGWGEGEPAEVPRKLLAALATEVKWDTAIVVQPESAPPETTWIQFYPFADSRMSLFVLLPTDLLVADQVGFYEPVAGYRVTPKFREMLEAARKEE